MRRLLTAATAAAMLAAAAVAAWSLMAAPAFTEAEKAAIASLSLAALPPLPPDPTNRVADLPRAAALGATLFFDTGLSRDGNVACATCHVADRQFQDDLPQGRGVGTTRRRTMPLAGAAYSPWQFWDGRKDSLWAQALGPLEDAAEHAGTRTTYAAYVARRYRDRYEGVFGPLPDLSGLPERASPLGSEAEKAAWAAMPAEKRRAVDAVFANIGKAIAAFERSIMPPQTRFDRFAAALAKGGAPQGDVAFSAEETAGLKLFVGRAQCVSCHTGPRLTDDHFHNTGVPERSGAAADHGRVEGVAKVDADPFNCLGAFSDAGPEACGELRFMRREGAELERAFKTPSLRGAAGRPPYMHAGQMATLDAVLDHYSRAPAAPSGHSELKPLDLSQRERAALAAFLRTLSPDSP